MHRSTNSRLAAWLGAALLLLAGNLAFAAAGTVEFVTGEARIQRGAQDIPAVKNARIESGDALVTGADGRMRVRMENGERIALHPNTKFVIDQFTPPESQDKPETGKSFYTFIRGGFDAVVASLGRRDTTSYRVKTPVATMGIRGTAYTMIWTPEGLYVQVTEGSITLTNAAGTLVVQAGQIGFVGLGGVAPVLVNSMPAIGAGVGAATGVGLGVGLGTTLGILGGLGGLAIILGNDGSSGSSTTTTTTTTTPAP
jgi:hypothetical protein